MITGIEGIIPSVPFYLDVITPTEIMSNEVRAIYCINYLLEHNKYAVMRTLANLGSVEELVYNPYAAFGTVVTILVVGELLKIHSTTPENKLLVVSIPITSVKSFLGLP